MSKKQEVARIVDKIYYTPPVIGEIMVDVTFEKDGQPMGRTLVIPREADKGTVMYSFSRLAHEVLEQLERGNHSHGV